MLLLRSVLATAVRFRLHGRAGGAPSPLDWLQADARDVVFSLAPHLRAFQGGVVVMVAVQVRVVLVVMAADVQLAPARRALNSSKLQ